MANIDYIDLSSRERAKLIDGGPQYIDTFKVDSDAYEKYKLKKSQLRPPTSELCTFSGCRDIRHVKIEQDDTWRVTHVINGRYLIQSIDYNDRQCRYRDSRGDSYWFVNIFGKCLRGYDFAIYISKRGEVTGGWILLPGPRKVGVERKILLDLNPSNKEGWPSGIVFQSIKGVSDK